MDKIFRVALLQLDAAKSQEKALQKGIASVKKAKQLNADIAVFPEIWNTGYEMLFEGNLDNQNDIDDESIRKWSSKAIDNNDDFIIQFRNLAKELQIAIVLTYLEKTEQQPKNTAIIIDRNGKLILKYSKVHTVDSKMEAYIKPGDNFYTCELDYERGQIKIGIMICFDRDFPESARILMLQGSEIILVPNACYMSQIRLEQLKIRAYENMVGIVCVNYANHGGRSSAYSPIVQDKNNHELNSEILIMDEKEDIKLVEFDIEAIRNYRKKGTLGDAYRKPYAYKQIIDNNIKEPFIRFNSRRK